MRDQGFFLLRQRTTFVKRSMRDAHTYWFILWNGARYLGKDVQE